MINFTLTKYVCIHKDLRVYVYILNLSLYQLLGCLRVYLSRDLSRDFYVQSYLPYFLLYLGEYRSPWIFTWTSKAPNFWSLFSICKSSVWNESTSTGLSGRSFKGTKPNNSHTGNHSAVKHWNVWVACWMVLVRGISTGGGTISSIARNKISCQLINAGTYW